MKQKITAGVTLLTALLLGVGPWTFFKACPVTPEKIMKCHWCCLALIPLALKGVKYREVSAAKMLSGNLLVYGLGGIIIPFAAIKAIDMLLTATGMIV